MIKRSVDNSPCRNAQTQSVNIELPNAVSIANVPCLYDSIQRKDCHSILFSTLPNEVEVLSTQDVGSSQVLFPGTKYCFFLKGLLEDQTFPTAAHPFYRHPFTGGHSPTQITLTLPYRAVSTSVIARCSRFAPVSRDLLNPIFNPRIVSS